MQSQLEAVSRSLNLLQADSTNLGEAANTWLMLSTSTALTSELQEAVQQKMKKAITPYHTFAKLVTNKAGCPVPMEMKEEVMEFLQDLNPSFPGIMAAFQTEDTSLFPGSAFIPSIKDILEPMKYWKYVAKNTKLLPLLEFCRLAMRVLTCPSSSAGNIEFGVLKESPTITTSTTSFFSIFLRP